MCAWRTKLGRKRMSISLDIESTGLKGGRFICIRYMSSNTTLGKANEVDMVRKWLS